MGFATSGGFIGDMDFGGQYLKGICQFFGIKEFESKAAEGLDIEGTDVEKILRQVEIELGKLAENW